MKFNRSYRALLEMQELAIKEGIVNPDDYDDRDICIALAWIAIVAPIVYIIVKLLVDCIW